ncbi:MAG TPA: ATP-binding protein [Ilumatobacteraceae bacterium]|jgi:anti-sigma regulatory factor (Ser/Thr protein kinase)
MKSAERESSAGLRREYEGRLTTLHTARHDVEAWLDERGADDATKERAVLIVSELSSNAVQNSAGRPYTLEVTPLDDDHAAISIRNHPVDHLPPPREMWRPISEVSLKQLSLRGRGLAIVDSLSENLTIEHLGDDVLVTALLRIVKKPT